MTINEIQDEIIEDFTLMDDWMDRYQLGRGRRRLVRRRKGRCQPDRRLPEPRMVGVRRRRRHPGIPRRKRRPDRQGYRRTTDARVERTYTPGNPGRRPLFHRQDRFVRTPLSNPQQWTSGNGKTDAHVRTRLSDKIGSGIIPARIDLVEIFIHLSSNEGDSKFGSPSFFLLVLHPLFYQDLTNRTKIERPEQNLSNRSHILFKNFFP